MHIQQTWQKCSDNYKLHDFASISVPRPESLRPRVRRGHGGICLFCKEFLKDGIEITDKNSDGFIWIKLCKTFFNFEEDLCICFAIFPLATQYILIWLILIILRYLNIIYENT